MEERVAAQAEIAARLERLPVTLLTWRIVIIAGLAWFTEALSIGSLGVSLPALRETLHLTPSDVGALVAFQTFGVVIGLIPAGRLADRYGRKRILIGGIVWYSVFTFLCGLVPGYHSLLWVRFAAGLGMGAIFPLPYAIVSEFVRKQHRTMFNGFMDACLSIGYFIAPLLGFVVFPNFDPTMSWRIFFMIAASPIIYAAAVYWLLPESPRWLARKGRLAEAEAGIAQLEAKALQATGRPLPPPEIPVPGAEPTVVSGRFSQLFGPALIGRTITRSISATGVFFMFYVVMTYMPTIFVSHGFKFATSLIFTAIITAAAIPGKLANGWLAERRGRRTAYVTFMGAAGIGAVFFAIAGSVTSSVLFACVMSFFGTGAFPALKMSFAEQYPIDLRATGSATVEAVSRFFGGVVGAYVLPVLLHREGQAISFVIIAIVAFIGVVTELTSTVETQGKTLEELEQVIGHKPEATRSHEVRAGDAV
ncbi:MFS transporter [Acidiphilium sp. AL]|uniref:MFS transporter n=1 Tax=Acidiphilium sp. AL TaxID=2871704 RepID=UPI0021CB2DF4|nr:MFS transporter [Acidiphilium sp. AL]MCU4160394.1 MFS transporter [Acidiphilium sp. AL]